MASLHYPRPDFDRSEEWLNLDGQWEFRRGSDSDPAVDLAAPLLEHIEVPFAWESQRSGIGASWLTRGVYRRKIAIPPGWQDRRTILHFGGVHHRARVYIDDVAVEDHSGVGPFDCDVTERLRGGEAQLSVVVDAPLDKRAICHGKQRSIPVDDYDLCAFQPSSGIWQSVWLEPRPATFIRCVRATAATPLDAFEVVVESAGPSGAGATATLELGDEGGNIVAALCDIAPRDVWRLAPPVAQLWSPEDPYLYTLHVRLESAEGTDSVRIPVGLRRIEVIRDEIHLNGQRIYLRGVLDQGYWPESGLTAPSTEALVRDLELARAAGYNLVRKHIKLEDPRWLHAADRAGMLVWAEPPSTGRYSPASVGEFREALRRMVERDANHPSVVIWGGFNEEWGLDWRVAETPLLQEEVAQAAQLLRSLDPTRPIVDNSGWSHVDTDLVDWHYYEADLSAWRGKVLDLLEQDSPEIPVPLRPPALEMKKLYAVPQRVRRPNLNSEYGWGSTSLQRGWYLKWQTQELRRHDGLSGYVYTELCDVEHEFAGVYRADRSPKDLGNLDPADVNAETVLVIDIVPCAPGCDLVTDGLVGVDVSVSHHGTQSIRGTLTWQWGPLLEEAPQRWDRKDAVEASAHPFALGDAARVEAVLPDAWGSGRLHLGLFVSDEIRARGALDVVRRTATES